MNLQNKFKEITKFIIETWVNAYNDVKRLKKELKKTQETCNSLMSKTFAVPPGTIIEVGDYGVLEFSGNTFNIRDCHFIADFERLNAMNFDGAIPLKPEDIKGTLSFYEKFLGLNNNITQTMIMGCTFKSKEDK